MTWQGGKRRREAGQLPVFARIKALAGDEDDVAKGLEELARALRDYETPVRLHLRLISGTRGDGVEHWEVRGGAGGAKAQRLEPSDADVIVVLRPETLMQIVRGRLAPYEALYAGMLRVGGDLEIAKAITRHLTDPAAVYVAPC